MIAADSSRIDSAARAAARLAAHPRDVRPAQPERIALLWGAPEGRAFLAAAAPRAFVLGAPAKTCPARSAAAGGEAAAGAVSAALSQCFAALKAAQAPDACGCQAVAVDDVLLAPLDAFAYAPGVSAWIKSPALGIDLHLPAREAAAPGGARRLEFLAGSDMLITAELRPDGTARMRILRPGAAPILLTGRHRPEGLRRGRHADRLRLRDEKGREAVVLSGYEPVEYAVRRRALLNWR